MESKLCRWNELGNQIKSLMCVNNYENLGSKRGCVWVDGAKSITRGKHDFKATFQNIPIRFELPYSIKLCIAATTMAMEVFGWTVGIGERLFNAQYRKGLSNNNVIRVNWHIRDEVAIVYGEQTCRVKTLSPSMGGGVVAPNLQVKICLVRTFHRLIIEHTPSPLYATYKLV